MKTNYLAKQKRTVYLILIFILGCILVLSFFLNTYLLKLQRKERLEKIISSNIPEIGHVEEKMNVEANSTEELKIAFSSKYMLDALKAVECDKIAVKFNGEEKPIIIKDVDNSDVTQLILPVKTY